MAAVNKKIRCVECIVLFFAVPCLLYYFRHQLAFRVFYLLALLASACTFMLMKTPGFDRSVLRRKTTKAQMRSMALLFIPAAVLLVFVTHTVLPDRFLAFPSTKPKVWLIVMVLYPFLMILPQELLFRCFFFQRYKGLFDGQPAAFIVLNALSFGLAHIFYGNWVAPTLSFVGGLLFAWRYQTSRSLLTVCIEHAVWGNFLFTIGIGWYFYSGAMR